MPVLIGLKEGQQWGIRSKLIFGDVCVSGGSFFHYCWSLELLIIRWIWSLSQRGGYKQELLAQSYKRVSRAMLCLSCASPKPRLNTSKLKTTSQNSRENNLIFFNIYLRCFKISSEGAGYRHSIEYKITFIVIIWAHCFLFSLQASFDHIKPTHNIISNQSQSIINYVQVQH